MLNDSPQVAAIRARYKASFVEKKQMIDSYLSQFDNESERGEALPAFHAELHKLAGSSGMYGYDDVSVLCRDVMQHINNSRIDDVLSDTKKLSELFGGYID